MISDQNEEKGIYASFHRSGHMAFDVSHEGVINKWMVWDIYVPVQGRANHTFVCVFSNLLGKLYQ